MTNNALQRPHKANGLRTRHALNDSCSAAPHYFGKKGASCKKCSQIGTCTCQQRHLTRLRMRSNSESDDRRTKTRASHLIYDTTGNRNARFSLPEQIRVQASSTHAHRLLRVKKKNRKYTRITHLRRNHISDAEGPRTRNLPLARLHSNPFQYHCINTRAHVHPHLGYRRRRSAAFLHYSAMAGKGRGGGEDNRIQQQQQKAA